MVCSLANALDITDEPRVITRGSPPFSILHTNKAWSTLTGYKFAEVVNRSTSFLQGPETERDQLLKLQVACQQGQHAKVRVLNYTKEGEPFVNSLEVHPLRDAEGVLTHWCGVLRGEKAPKFTKTLMREAAVQPSSSSSSSRSSAGATSSATPMPAAATAARGGSRRAAAQQQLMLPDPELMPLRPQPAGAPSSALLPSQGLLPTPLQHLMLQQQTMLQQRAVPLQHQMPRVGETRPANATPAQNLHRPKRQKGAKVRVADALNNTSDAVVMTQPFPPYKITHVNQPWIEMCGYTQEDVEGRTNALLQGPETDTALVADLMSCVSRGESASAAVYNYRKSGEKFLNQVQVTPVYNDDDELEQFMAMLHEVDV